MGDNVITKEHTAGASPANLGAAAETCNYFGGSENHRLRDQALVTRITRTVDPADIDTFSAVENLLGLARAYTTLMEHVSEHLSQFGLSPAKVNVLLSLRCAPNHRLSMSELGEQMAVTGANITKLVDGLERERLVRRAQLPCDRRVVLAELTDDGEALLRSAMPVHLARLRALWSCVSIDERAELVHLLTKLRMSLKAADMAIEEPKA